MSAMEMEAKRGDGSREGGKKDGWQKGGKKGGWFFRRRRQKGGMVLEEEWSRVREIHF